MISDMGESTRYLICNQNCPGTSEYDPVCGTDGVTYMNPSRLRCAQACGRNGKLIIVRKFGFV